MSILLRKCSRLSAVLAGGGLNWLIGHPAGFPDETDEDRAFVRKALNRIDDPNVRKKIENRLCEKE